MQQQDVDKYLSILNEIKRRTKVLDAFIFQQTHALYLQTTLESACLQVRKILELIAFGSLVSNNKEFSRQHEKFSKLWNASLMLKDMQRINPEFYPYPIIQKKSEKDGIHMEFIERSDDYLTQARFIKVYEKCGAILHANNPFGTKVDSAYYQASLPKWRHYIINLLDAHIIKILGSEKLYLFQMGKDQSYPNYNEFALVDKIG